VIHESSCPYCQRPLGNEKVLSQICEFEYSLLSIFKNQYYKGRCVLSVKGHYEELHELDSKTYMGFMNELHHVCTVINELFSPDKIQIAMYGDTVRHVHFHIVPKYKQLPDWTMPFSLHPKSTSIDSWKAISDTILEKLNADKIIKMK